MGELYKAYIPTKNKRALIPFKNVKIEDLYTYEQVVNLPSYAGLLCDDTVLIDIDDKMQSQKLLNIVVEKGLRCKVYETSRGLHFLFKVTPSLISTNKTDCKLACGLSADIKLGSRCSYEVLKHDGKLRKVIYDSGDYELVPKYLTPVKTNLEFVGLTNGGRNSTLYGYILPLQHQGFTISEIRECIHIINDYVLEQPLSETEINTILRDDAFDKPNFFGKNGCFQFDKFATYLKNNNNIIKLDNQLHLYREGIYMNSPQNIEAEMIEEIPTLNKAKRAEVLAYLNILVRENSRRAKDNYIVFKNGVYDVNNNSLSEFSPELIITNKLNVSYNPDAYDELMDKTLDKMACYDKAIRALLEECIGYCMSTSTALQKAFILTGDRSNGKSTFLTLVSELVGDENVAALDLKELDSRFKTAELFGKLVNIGDDIGDEFIANPAIFKKLVTGNRVNAERKGTDPFDFENYSKLLFSANNIPRIKDKTGAVQRRLVIIPFNNQFSVNDPDYDPYIKYKLMQRNAMEYLAQLGLKGLKRLFENQKFTTSEKVESELLEYELFNNPILGFFEEIGEDGILNQPTKFVFNEYQKYCMENSMQPMSNVEFSKQVKRHFSFDVAVRKINSKSVRIFIKK